MRLTVRKFQLKIYFGKSGKVKITIEYVNKDEHIVDINGKSEKLYTPFVVACATILDNEIHKNIEVTNGKIINDGNRTAVIGIAMPGLQESLGIDKEDLDIPSMVKISMDTENFEIGNVFSFITPKVLEEDDLKGFDGLDEIYDKVNFLASSSRELENGASTLKGGMDIANNSYSKIDDGINTLYDASSDLTDGAKKVSDGTKAVSTNLQSIDNGIGDLQSGTKKLYAGAKTLNSSINEMVSGIHKALDPETISLLQKVSALKIPDKISIISDPQIVGLRKSNSAFLTQAASFKPGADGTSATSASVVAVLEAQITAISADTTLDATTKQSQIQALKVAEAAVNAMPNAYALVAGNNEAYQSIEDKVNEELKQVTDSLPTDTDVNALLASMQKLTSKLNEDNLKKLTNGTQSLESGLSDLLEGEQKLKAGASTLANASKELASGSNDLYNGTLKVADGTKTLNDGSKEMKDGLNALSYGTSSLASGVSKFNREGIDTVVNMVNGDLMNVSTKLEKLKDLAEEYKTFTAIDKENQSEVKFICIVDEIKKKD